MKLFSLAEKYFENPDSTLQISPYHIYSEELSFGFASSQKDGKELHLITRDMVTSLSRIRDGTQTNVVFNHNVPIRLRLLLNELPVHYADYYEIHYVMDGTLCLEIEGKPVCFYAGEVCVINSMATRRELLDRSDCLMLNILIDNKVFLDAFLSSPGLNAVKQYLHRMIIRRSETQHYLSFTPISETYTEQIDEYLSVIFTEIIGEQIGYLEISKGYLNRLMNCLTNNYQYNYNRKESRLYEEKLFESVRDYMNTHLDAVCMDDLAEIFHFQTNYFNNLIKKHTGMTYSQYLIFLRMEQAKRLLYSSDIPIEEIMLLIGYNNKGFFYKKFQEQVGMSPKAYRKKHLQQI